MAPGPVVMKIEDSFMIQVTSFPILVRGFDCLFLLSLTYPISVHYHARQQYSELLL